MAGFFTLPELRAELRSLGHDDVPDHVISAFLSQLQLTIPKLGNRTDESFVNSISPISNRRPRSKDPCSGFGSAISVSDIRKNEPSRKDVPFRPTKAGNKDVRTSTLRPAKAGVKRDVMSDNRLWETDYLASAFNGLWKEEFDIDLTIDLERSLAISDDEVNPAAGFFHRYDRLKEPELDYKRQIFKEWKVTKSRECDRRVVDSCEAVKGLGKLALISLASPALSPRQSIVEYDESKENDISIQKGIGQDALPRQVLQPCENLLQDLYPSERQGGAGFDPLDIHDRKAPIYTKARIETTSQNSGEVKWEGDSPELQDRQSLFSLQGSSDCSSVSSILSEIASTAYTSESSATTVGIETTRLDFRSHNFFPQTHSNHGAMEDCHLQNNKLAAGSLNVTNEGGSSDVSDHGQRKSHRTSSGLSPYQKSHGPGMEGQFQFKFTEGAVEVASNSKKSTTRREIGTSRGSASPLPLKGERDTGLSSGPQRHFSRRITNLRKASPSTFEWGRALSGSSSMMERESPTMQKSQQSEESPSPSNSASYSGSHSPSTLRTYTQQQEVAKRLMNRKPVGNNHSPSLSGPHRTSVLSDTKTVISEFGRGKFSPARRGGKIDRVARFAEMQKVWKNDSFLKTSGTKRKPENFNRRFANVHATHALECSDRKPRAQDMHQESSVRTTKDSNPPFIVPSIFTGSERV